MKNQTPQTGKIVLYCSTTTFSRQLVAAIFLLIVAQMAQLLRSVQREREYCCRFQRFR
jgi:hypothetical protein